MRRLCTLLVFAAAAVLLITSAGYAKYLPPVGGWTYTYTGDAGSGGAGYTALDGTWSHDNGFDQWDESGIGAGRPGGVSVLPLPIPDPGNYLRLQETGDPRDYGMGDPGSNRNLMFGHSITNDIGGDAGTILDGVTISFRARVATGSPLDDLHPDGGGGVEPWPASGDGYVIHDGGKGSFGVRQSEGDKIISFALATGADLADQNYPGNGGLVMNLLNGTTPTGNVDMQGHEGEGLNLLSLDVTAWHEFWITIEPDNTKATGTHIVKVYKDDSLVSDDFFVTAGDGNDFGDSYLELGLGATPQSGAIDVDFYSYAAGVHAPIPEPSTLVMLVAVGLTGLLLRRRRR
jgi:hypothetical protein